jgi:RNA recognition motif-containing protein
MKIQGVIMETRIYVGNLSEETTENELMQLFSQAGTVASVMLMKDQESGRSKGFASIEMKDEAGADKAVKMFHGEIFAKRQLKVILAWHRKGFGSGGYSRSGSNEYRRPGGGYWPSRPGEGYGSRYPRKGGEGSNGKARK